MALQSYELATGWDNEAGFTNVEDITVTDARTLPMVGSPVFFVEGISGFSRGQRRFDASGGASFNGFERVALKCAVVDPLAYAHIRDNYVGQVTVRTTRGEKDTFGNYNAYLRIPDPEEMELRNGMYYGFEFRLMLVSST